VPGASGRSASGTNFGIRRAIGTILFDEKIGGTVHLALGRSYPETGGKNVSALHWDLICDLRPGGRLSADGETIMQDGNFVWPSEPGEGG
jgi:aminopeptidase